MDFNALRAQLIALLEAPATEREFDLVDVTVAGSTKHPIVSVFLDDGKGNQLEALAQANGWVDELIESAGLLQESYTLEISSPGVNRHLRKLSDFERFAGEKAEIKVAASKGERSVFKGVLDGVDNTDVLIVVDGNATRVPYEAIIKAHLQVDIDFKSLKGTTKNGK